MLPCASHDPNRTASLLRHGLASSMLSTPSSQAQSGGCPSLRLIKELCAELCPPLEPLIRVCIRQLWNCSGILLAAWALQAMAVLALVAVRLGVGVLDMCCAAVVVVVVVRRGEAESRAFVRLSFSRQLKRLPALGCACLIREVRLLASRVCNGTSPLGRKARPAVADQHVLQKAESIPGDNMSNFTTSQVACTIQDCTDRPLLTNQAFLPGSCQRPRLRIFDAETRWSTRLHRATSFP